MSDSPASFTQVLAVPQFRRLWLAHVFSVVGDQLARVALTVLVYERTNSAGLTALTYALTYLPDFVGGATLAGLADRFPRRSVMVHTDLARAALVALMAVPGMPLLAQAALLFVVQAVASPFASARQSVLADMLPGDQLTAGFALVSMTSQASFAVGFGAGAALVAEFGTSAALLVDVVTFLASAAIIRLGIDPYRPAVGAGPRGATGPPALGYWATVRAGWAVVAGDARLRTLLAVACCAGFYAVPEGLAVPFGDELGGGTAAVGWLLAANPVGTVLGMIGLRFLGPQRRLALLGPMAVGSSLILLPTGWAPGLAVTVVLWTLSGVLSAHDIVAQSTYVRLAPAESRGQAIGVAVAALRAAQGLAIVAAGLLAQFADAAVIVGVAAAAGTVVTAVAVHRWRRAAAAGPEPLTP
ncbi:MFS transporter [Jiangella alba]|uniref:Predicted arabinose efflux permease, MFS family n=1 Tax=Jiangella alba TaxID=561176 RepID=A0A1H5Q0E8_9ACTN|nr:MFS transporter [Jiangella alba]SEF18921.1 Predicted arabinose efflux permease, MFS family [Jiangella alba]